MELKNDWNNRVMIVDDQEEIHQDFKEMLTPSLTKSSSDDLAKAFDADIDLSFLPEFELLHAKSGREAYEKIKAAIEDDNPIAVAYIDIRMPPGMDGIETTRRIREIDKDLEIVIITAYTDKPLSEIVHDMELLNKLLYIRKPFAREEIQQMTLSLVEKWNIEKELAEKNQQLAFNKQRLECVLDSTGDGIAMFDATRHILFANRWYRKMFGLTDQELKEMSADKLRQHIKQFFQEPARFEAVEKSLCENPEKVFEEIAEMKLPERKMLYRFTAPVHDDKENIIGRIIVYRDVSKELEIEQMKTEVRRLRAELETKYSFDKIIGKSSKMRDMYALMQRAIESELTVLIQGESGTGKELVAKAIHFNSERKTCPFIPVNCAAIPETLIESELFGHERGAFTGATMRRIGKFEQADGGTILLDEIGEMHPSIQAKLLRVLQEREIQRIGGTGNIPINIRLITSTNKDLQAAMKVGKFREDLFYRIAVFPIVIPPLRERREDIPLLAKHFLKYVTERNNKPIAGLSTGALQLLMGYDWPGNVRELENVIERVTLFEESNMIQASSLPLEIRSVDKQFHIPTSQGEDSEAKAILPFEEVEKQAIIHALKVTGNNIQQTAEALGIDRVTVYRKIKKYDLHVT